VQELLTIHCKNCQDVRKVLHKDVLRGLLFHWKSYSGTPFSPEEMTGVLLWLPCGRRFWNISVKEILLNISCTCILIYKKRLQRISRKQGQIIGFCYTLSKTSSAIHLVKAKTHPRGMGSFWFKRTSVKFLDCIGKIRNVEFICTDWTSSSLWKQALVLSVPLFPYFVFMYEGKTGYQRKSFVNF